MKRLRQLAKRLTRANAALDKRPFAHAMDANVAMLRFEETGELPANERQAQYIQEWDAMLKAMEDSVPKVPGEA